MNTQPFPAQGAAVQARRLLVSAAWAAVVAFALTGCRTPPDLRPFTDATAQLTSSIKLTGRTVASELDAMSAGWGEPWESRAREIREKFSQQWLQRAGLADALQDYSASLTAIAQAGEQGEKSARAVAESFKKLCGAIEVALPPAAAVDGVVSISAQLYGRFARDYAAKTLGEGMRQLQPSIDETARLLSHSLEQVATGLDAIRDQSEANLEEQVVYAQGGQKWLVRQERGELTRLLARRTELLDLLRTAEDARDKLRRELLPSAPATPPSDPSAGELKGRDAQHLELQRLTNLSAGIIAELAAVDAAVKTSTERLASYDSRQTADRERLSAQIALVSAVRSGLTDWAAAHSRLAAAALEKKPIQVEDLVQTALEIRELVKTLRNTPRP